MSQLTVADLRQQLDSENSRLDALEAIGRIESFDKSLATELVPSLVNGLETATNTYARLQILKQLRRISREQPEIASSAIRPVAETVNERLTDFDGDDPSASQWINWGADILEAVIQGTDPLEAKLNLEFDDVRSIIQHGEQRHRAIGYRLLGRTGKGEAVRILLQDFSHEFDNVVAARDTALEEASELTLVSIDGSGPVDRIDAIDAFSELYSSNIVEPDREDLRVVRRGLFELIGSLNDQRREVLFGSIERICRRDRDFAGEIVSKAFELLSTDANEKFEIWGILESAAEGAPSVVLDHPTEIATHIESSDTIASSQALDVLRVASGHIQAAPAELAGPVLHQLDPTADRVIKAIETVANMGFYPPPDRLISLIESEDARVASAAAEAQESLADRDNQPQFVRDLRSGRATVRLPGDDTGDIFLKTRTQDGYWEDISMGRLRDGIIQTALKRQELEENVPIVYPYFHPTDIIALSVSLVLSDPGEEFQVGLYSPGSQTQWGTKGQIRAELREFGLSNRSGEVVSSIPITEILPEAYVWDGQVKHSSEGEGPGRVILTKKLRELREIPDLDLVVLNLTSNTREDHLEGLESLEDAKPETQLVSAYSYYTRHGSEGRDRYGPPTGLESTQTIPGVDLIDPLLAEETDAVEGSCPDCTGGESESWILGEDEVRAFGKGHLIRFEHVETETLSELFDQLFGASASLRDTDDGGAGGLIFSRHLFFERLPIPAEDFDEWVRERYYEGDRFVPPLVQERIDDVERKAGTVENLEAVQPLNNAKRILETIHDRLRSKNPLYEVLKDHVKKAQENDERLAIFSASPKNAQLLRDTLSKNDVLPETQTGGTRIEVVSPDEAREMDVFDKLLIFGALHPENAGFYVFPRVKETIVVTYDRAWAGMVQRHASDFVELLNQVIGGMDYSPFPDPTLSGDLPIEETDEEIDEGEMEPAPAVSTDDSNRSKDQILADAMRSVSVTEYGEDQGRYERELRYFVIETTDGEMMKVTNHDSILRHRSSSAGDEVHWVTPESLTPGDMIVTLPEGLQDQLWREHLEDLYEDGLGTERAADRIQSWYEALNEIWELAGDQLEGGDVNNDGALHRKIHGWITREVDGFDRSPVTVRTWFDSVRDAEGPMDLAQNPSFVLGPRSHSDIEAIGLAFGFDELAEESVEIEAAMQGIRTINQREGHEFRDSLREQVNSPEENRVSEAATVREVKEVREVEQSFEIDGDSPEPGAPVNKKTIDRVHDIVELAPTKNGELADEWGFESGAEVYEALSTELEDYYERNDNKLIVPSQEAKDLVRGSEGG